MEKRNNNSGFFSRRPGMRNFSGQKQNYVVGDKRYARDCTVRIEKIPTNAIGERIVIEDVEEITGLNTVLAVVQNDASSYDVTLDCKENAFKLMRGVDIANKEFQCSMLFSDITVVSIMKLPSFIEDKEIVGKLRSKGVEVVSPVYRRAIPGTQVADGTRFMRCRFPPGLVALPWTIPFKIDSTVKYFRLVHNNQAKVCSECMSPEHMRRDCPYFECHGCGERGHSMKQCNALKCPHCQKLPLKCVCGPINDRGQSKSSKNSKDCKDCGKYFCMCKCNICGNAKCTCVCYVCEKEPCECKCSFCRSDPCVCPCQDCKKYPCECQCDNCLQPYNDCMCIESDDKEETVVMKRPEDELEEDEKSETFVKEVETIEEIDNGVASQIIVTVDIHNEQCGTQEESRKRKMDNTDESSDDRTDDDMAANELNQVESESKKLGTDREFSEGKKIKMNNDSTPFGDNISTKGSEYIENIEIQESAFVNENECTSVGDEIISTGGAKESKTFSVCSDDEVIFNAKNLEIENEGEKVELDGGKFINAKEARKIKKKERKIERRNKLKVSPNLDGKNVRCIVDSTKM